MLAPILMAIPRLTKGLVFVPKNEAGQPLKSKVEALDTSQGGHTAQLMLPSGTVDKESVATTTKHGAVHEIKEWQAIMDHLRGLPVTKPGELPVIPVDERASEGRAIKAGAEVGRNGIAIADLR